MANGAHRVRGFAATTRREPAGWERRCGTYSRNQGVALIFLSIRVGQEGDGHDGEEGGSAQHCTRACHKCANTQGLPQSCILCNREIITASFRIGSSQNAQTVSELKIPKRRVTTLQRCGFSSETSFSIFPTHAIYQFTTAGCWTPHANSFILLIWYCSNKHIQK
jgi:hypothetical protein